MKSYEKQLNSFEFQWKAIKIFMKFYEKQLKCSMTYQLRKHDNKTNYFCENWNFSFKMIAIILILVSKTWRKIKKKIKHLLEV